MLKYFLGLHRHFTFLLSFCFFSVNNYAQSQGANQFSLSLNKDSIYTTIEVLCSDSMAGRETGKTGQKKTALYLAGKFDEFGLLPLPGQDYLHTHFLSLRVNKGKNMEVHQKFFLFGEDFYYQGQSTDTLLVLDSILYTGINNTDLFVPNLNTTKNASRNLLLIDFPESKKTKGTSYQRNLQEKIVRWKTVQPRLILLATADFRTIRDSLIRIEREGVSGEVSRETGIPVIYISMELAEHFLPESDQYRLGFLMRDLKKKNKNNSSFLSKTDALIRLLPATQALYGENVLAMIPGNERKEEYVLVTAHYDHLGVRDSLIYRGADDNASGTAGMMEMARIFSEAAGKGYVPRRNILFMAVSGEEKGLLGSTYFVENPPFPLKQIIANVNTDMIGRVDSIYARKGDSNYIYVIGAGKMSSELFDINEFVNASHVNLILDYKYDDEEDPNRFFYRSDHYNFVKNGIPAIFYFNGVHEDYHKASDTPEKLNIELLTLRTRLAFLTIWELANREHRIKPNVKTR